jgi:hypothetical protein
MSDGLTVYTEAFDSAFARMLATSKRDIQVVAEEQMRGVIRGVIGITPPAHIVKASETAWSVVQGGEAKSHGMSLVSSDIRSIYGLPRDAYNDIRAKDADQAAAFWRYHKRHETDAASAIARKVLGKGLYQFDGGKAHQNLKRGRARGRAKSFIFYIDSKAPLDAYVREIQARVGWLAAGWNEAAAKLGVKPQQWIWRHAAPGSARVEVNDNGIKITATNAVNYASVSDLERRVQYALDEQAAAMNRRVDDFMKSKFRIPGFIIS